MKKPASYEAGYLRILSTPKFGGDKRDRTADLLNAIQALSQLSYTPNFSALSLSARDILPETLRFVNTILKKIVFLFGEACGGVFRGGTLCCRQREEKVRPCSIPYTRRAGEPSP